MGIGNKTNHVIRVRAVQQQSMVCRQKTIIDACPGSAAGQGVLPYTITVINRGNGNGFHGCPVRISYGSVNDYLCNSITRIAAIKNIFVDIGQSWSLSVIQYRRVVSCCKSNTTGIAPHKCARPFTIGIDVEYGKGDCPGTCVRIRSVYVFIRDRLKGGLKIRYRSRTCQGQCSGNSVPTACYAKLVGEGEDVLSIDIAAGDLDGCGSDIGIIRVSDGDSGINHHGAGIFCITEISHGGGYCWLIVGRLDVNVAGIRY